MGIVIKKNKNEWKKNVCMHTHVYIYTWIRYIDREQYCEEKRHMRLTMCVRIGDARVYNEDLEVADKEKKIK